MIKKLLYLLLLIFSFTAFSQEITRIKINGKITASKGEDVEGINILNKSSQKGTITSENGEFELMVAENDRVFVSAIQFQRFSVIIDEGIIETKTMFIYLNPVVNQLDEIVIRPFDISGNIVADVKRVNVISVNSAWDLSYENLEYGYEFSDDAQSSIRGNKAEEAYFNGPVQGGGNVLGLAKLFFPNKKKTEREVISEAELKTDAVQKRFGNVYISKTFNIPEEKVNEFIYFVEENGIDKKLLQYKNELLLIEYLHIQSKKYLEQSHEE